MSSPIYVLHCNVSTGSAFSFLGCKTVCASVYPGCLPTWEIWNCRDFQCIWEGREIVVEIVKNSAVMREGVVAWMAHQVTVAQGIARRRKPPPDSPY